MSHATIPDIELNNGVRMPMMALGTGGYNDSMAQTAVEVGLPLGFSHIDTAHDYHNQKGISNVLKSRLRSSFFLTTKVVSDAPHGSYDETKQALEMELNLLDLAYVDLMLLHTPPLSNDCTEMQMQWKAMEDFYKAGKAKAIGVSEYCVSSLKCIAETASITPAVNQIGYHVGGGADPWGIKSYGDSKRIVTQSYSPLCGWDCSSKAELINGDLVTSIGNAHHASGPQVALRWIIENGVPLATKSIVASHLKDDLAVFDFSLTPAEKARLDAATSPSGPPSIFCSSEYILTM